MKLKLALFALVVAVFSASAQESLPLEEAQKIAQLLVQNSTDLKDAQIKVEPDAQKPRGFKSGDVGSIVLPDRRVTADALAKAGKETVALGQLWTRTIALVKGGSPIANDKLRLVNIMTKDDKTVSVQLYLVGVRQAEKGKLELVVFGKDKAPLLQVPLEASESTAEFPLEISGRKSGEDSGIITLNVLGKYKAELPVMKQAE